MRILVTGSRHWTDRRAIADALQEAVWDLDERHDGELTVLVHGACPYGGADQIAAQFADEWGWTVEPHEAKENRAAAFRARNREMVELGADVCLAFLLPSSRGTWHCLRLAERAGIPVRRFTPDALAGAGAHERGLD